MGDRGNVAMIYQGPPGEDLPPVYFYTHWAGSRLPFTVQRALARMKRWEDGPYLARIIFCEMVKGQEGGETGYGISPVICDNEHPIITVDCRNGTVGFADRHDLTDPVLVWPFEKFIALGQEEMEEAFNSRFYEHSKVRVPSRSFITRHPADS